VNSTNKRLILLELNEINFDIVEKYIVTNPTQFPALKKLLQGPRIRTDSERKYEELEPWIQWPSVHTGKIFAEHKVFRLGDIIGKDTPQIFEILECAGFKVGAISPMNAENRLKNPAYFIPDPWTKTQADKSFWSRILSQAISQAVNDNAQSKITIKSIIQLVVTLLRFAKSKHYLIYISLIANSRKRSWNKALFLDLLLHDVHLSLFNTTKANFSTLFLNAGAHIQHHYFFNSAPLKSELSYKNPDWYLDQEDDPLADMLSIYDIIVSECLGQSDTEILLATGLTQKPYDRIKYYYRLNSHEIFLTALGINFSSVHPLMTRDFVVEFSDEVSARDAQDILKGLKVESDGMHVFGEIDNRGRSLFVTLSYSNEITDSTKFIFNLNTYFLKNFVSFVAVKNGMHHAEGFAFFTQGISGYAPKDKSHVSALGKSIADFFGVTF
jgi:hypothetical protein